MILSFGCTQHLQPSLECFALVFASAYDYPTSFNAKIYCFSKRVLSGQRSDTYPFAWVHLVDLALFQA